MEKRESFEHTVQRLSKEGFSDVRIAEWLAVPVRKVSDVLDALAEMRANAFDVADEKNGESRFKREKTDGKSHVTSAMCRFPGTCEWMCGPGRYCVWPTCFKCRVPTSTSKPAKVVISTNGVEHTENFDYTRAPAQELDAEENKEDA